MSENFYRNIIIGISILVPALVAALFFVSVPEVGEKVNLKFFPKFHATINSITAVLLVAGLYFIKRKQITAHKVCMLGSAGLSVVFLCSYVFYHSISEPTGFGGEGAIRYVYYFILLTHIVLAAIILPFVLFTLFRAFTKDFVKHKKIARLTLPLWLYVAVTGVLVYVFMAPYY